MAAKNLKAALYRKYYGHEMDAIIKQSVLFDNMHEYRLADTIAFDDERVFNECIDPVLRRKVQQVMQNKQRRTNATVTLPESEAVSSPNQAPQNSEQASDSVSASTVTVVDDVIKTVQETQPDGGTQLNVNEPQPEQIQPAEPLVESLPVKTLESEKKNSDSAEECQCQISDISNSNSPRDQNTDEKDSGKTSFTTSNGS